jgi:hypothetical protein
VSEARRSNMTLQRTRRPALRSGRSPAIRRPLGEIGLADA